MILGSIIGALAGGGIGLLISKNVSRFTGGVCPVLCNPRVAVPYFAIIGLILAQEIIHYYI